MDWIKITIFATTYSDKQMVYARKYYLICLKLQ